MRILNATPGDGSGSIVGWFNVELSPDLRLRNLTLRRGQDGHLSVFAPNVRGGNVATFSPALAGRLAAAAHSYLEAQANDHHAAA